MKIIITSGATREHIDRVRFISNISTGRLGSLLASQAVASGFEAIYIHGVDAVLPASNEKIQLYPIISADDTRQALENCLKDPEVKAVIHPMAVSDYTPVETAPGKLASDKAEMAVQLKPVPKLTALIKKQRPDILLIMFKLESGLSRDELIDRAKQAQEKAEADLIVANLLEQTDGDNHNALLIDRETVLAEITGKDQIAQAILNFVEQQLM